MRWRTTALLFLILLGLGIFYYVYEIRLAPGREKAGREKDRLWSVEARDVEEVIVTRREDTVHVKRDGDGWRLLVPVRAQAEKTVIQDLVANLATARMEREIDPTPSRLDEFGLDNRAVEITLRLKGKGEPLRLFLGGRNPTGAWVYARTGDQRAVFALPDSVLRDATRPVADFRDRTILAFDRKEVTALEVSARGQVLAAEAEGALGWRVARPAPLKADGERIANFLDKLVFTRVKEFVAETPPTLGPYGLDQPARVTVRVGKEKDRRSHELLLGRLDPAKKGVYALRPGEQSVLLLGEEIGNLLPRTVFDLRDKTVVSYERDKLLKLSLDSSGGRVTLVREGREWRITAPESVKADEAQVSAYLGKLQELRARAVVTESASGANRFLPRPALQVSLWEKAAQAPKTLALGPSSERRDGAPMAYAALLDQGPVVLVDARFLQELARSVHDLRDRGLFAPFDTRDVRRIQVKSGGQAMLIERQGEGEWRVLEPRKGKAREGAVNDLLYALRTLKWSEQLSARGEESARHGLEQPSFEVTLWKTDGGELGGLVVGRRDRDKAYLKTRTSPALYTVDARQLENLPKTPDDFQ